MKFIQILILGLFTFMFSTNIFAADNSVSIIDIDSSNSSLLKIYFDNDIETNSTDLDSDIKLFRDLESESIVRDLKNDKLITINLSEELKINTSYSLLSVFWAEWSIDFKIANIIDWLEVSWNLWDWISKINIVNSKQLQVSFVDSIKVDEVDVKLLREHSIDSLKFITDNKKELDLYLSNKLFENSKYIIMLFSITTKEGVNYNISNSIYDFTTNWLSEEVIENVVEEVIPEAIQTENIALNSAATPKTWAETWVILFWTFLLSSFIFFRKRIFIK